MIQPIPTNQAATILMEPNSEEDYFHYQSNLSNNKFQNKKIEFSNCKNHISKTFLRKNLPKSPMPKHMSSASYNNLTDLGFESEEEEDDDDEEFDDEDDDEDDEDDYESNTDIIIIPEEEQNMLRTESTKSLAKVNPLLFSISNYPHKQPKTENFKIGSVVKDNVEDIKHLHLPRTPFPQTMNNSNTSLESSDLTDKKEEISLDLKKSTMLNRRRTSSTHQSPLKSILKTEDKIPEDL